jgi:tetratricopeptide (TPR) repeat protein
VQWIGLGYLDDALLRSLAATLVDVFGHVEIYQPGNTAGLLFAASGEPLDSLAGVNRALQAAPADYARFGIHRVEDFAAVRVLDADGVRELAAGAELNTDDHNLLASRAASLGDTALDSDKARLLWQGGEPVLTEADGIDRSTLIRGLVAANFKQRAETLALSGEGADEEIGLGWFEFALGRPGRAARHFARALELAPGTSDAVLGLVASRPAKFVQGKSIAGISEADLDDRIRAWIVAWRSASAKDWDAVAALEPELASFGPGEALFEEAARLRAHWRLASGDPQRASEAQAITETLLTRTWNPQDALLRASAAIAADHPMAAWASLIRLSRVPQRSEQGRTIAAHARKIAMGLPEEAARDMHERLNPAPASAPDRPRTEAALKTN